MAHKMLEAYSSFSWKYNKWQTYYKKIEAVGGQAKSNAFPLVIANGGPLLSHDYCIPLADLAKNPTISYVLFYDQIGCGKSSHLQAEEFPDFWATNVEQLFQLLTALDLTTTGYYLFGHSMGSLLVSTYAFEHPEGLQRLILANAIASFADVRDRNYELFRRLPSDIGQSIIEFEEVSLGKRKETKITQEQYLHAVGIFRAKHFLRNANPSANWHKSIENVMSVFHLYPSICGGQVMMLWGEPLSEYSSVPFLHEINVPTLIIKGEYDQTDDSCQKPLLESIPNVEEVKIPGASHIMTEEVPGLLNEAIGNYLRKEF